MQIRSLPYKIFILSWDLPVIFFLLDPDPDPAQLLIRIRRIRIHNTGLKDTQLFPLTLCLALQPGGLQRPPGSSWGSSSSSPGNSGTSSRLTGNRPTSPGGIIGHSARELLLLLLPGDKTADVDEIGKIYKKNSGLLQRF